MKGDIFVYSNGVLIYKNKKYKCAVGKGGVKENKKEGDMATPVGCFLIREIFYRKDKMGRLVFPFETKAINKNDAWCDDLNDKRYNTYITLKDGEQSQERLWREDDLYDIVVVLGYNDAPVIFGKGSAIFMHVAREGYSLTHGCITLQKKDLIEILSNVSKKTKVCVTGKEWIGTMC
jgi:L,D-peptidoglycan transpeptidase YkuD (ErfK/YbiS/YcfS/YnhG family)